LSEDELKECKKQAVPYIFNNGIIFDKIVEEQKKIFDLHKYALRYKEKYAVLSKLYDKDSSLKKINSYIHDNNIHTVAIYGYGDIGRILLDYLNELNIKVEYIVDRNTCMDAPYPLIDPNDELPGTDLLLVTIIDNEFKTTNLMKTKLDGYVMRLQDLL
jgi:lactate dehydrogenase-like 2-hydroxyacid dehydrogenase